MLNATISADIIASSSLSAIEIDLLTDYISKILVSIDEYQTSNGGGRVISRLILGDTIECFIANPNDALRVALIIKSGIKSFKLHSLPDHDAYREKLRKLFEIYGLRMAIGIGEMDTELLDKNIFNGSAITISGRLISEQKTSNKERVTVKNTMLIGSVDEDHHTYIFRPMLSLLDTLFSKMTQRQSEIIYRKLLGRTEGEIANEFSVTQSSINQHSTNAGWHSVEEALNLFSTYNF